MFLFIIPALCAAAGIAIGTISNHAASEKDRQKAKHLNRVNNDLINKRNALQKCHEELSDRSNQQLSEYERQLANFG